ncbi:glutaredoxin family protein [Neptuniibacter halophilus]|uniref:glutaredoxin family protein n=1 Tax=Neptuniibacter halophilus TaxID=651666 RepID=UPI0025722CF4|nr:glutaredoxin family protein [Neptuniibacter halophilus]
MCEVAAQLIAATVDMQQYAIYQVDIADDDQLLEAYAVRIPVLVDLSSGKELSWPFDQTGLSDFLSQLDQPA